MIIRNVKDFNVRHIIECGQCFRWEKKGGGSYDIAAMHRRLNVNCHEGVLTLSCSLGEFEEIWRDYFDLDRDYSAIKAKISSGDPVMARAVDHGWGIRILKQDLWETIVAFIISQNNNISRIKGCMERLCGSFGDPLVGFAGEEEGTLTRDIPRPDVLAGLTVDDLAPVRLGYRAEYLIRASRQIMERGLPRDRKQLLALTGVGPKVASCIELFGMGNMKSFPIDVWVRRLMHEFYGLDEKDGKAMEAFARDRFGSFGGIAQQYLFYYEREKKNVQ